MDEYKQALYLPSGLKLKKEFARGFGKDELIPTIIAAFIFLIIDCILYMFGIQSVPILFFVPLIGISIVGMMQVKGELNLSPVDVIKLELKFMKEQKFFPYIAKNEWENIS